MSSGPCLGLAQPIDTQVMFFFLTMLVCAMHFFCKRRKDCHAVAMYSLQKSFVHLLLNAKHLPQFQVKQVEATVRLTAPTFKQKTMGHVYRLFFLYSSGFTLCLFEVAKLGIANGATQESAK